jgi:hypothetical protein
MTRLEDYARTRHRTPTPATAAPTLRMALGECPLGARLKCGKWAAASVGVPKIEPLGRAGKLANDKARELRCNGNQTPQGIASNVAGGGHR